MRGQFSSLAVVVMLAACGGGSSSPTQPSAPSARTEWLVTQRFVSVSGPDNCWVREQRTRWSGAIFSDLPMLITRSGRSITVEGDFFQVNYAGTVSGSEFSASGIRPLEGNAVSCRDGTSFQQMPGTSSLSARFSADDQLMTAAEVNTYRLTSGDPVIYTWDWQARRQN